MTPGSRCTWHEGEAHNGGLSNKSMLEFPLGVEDWKRRRKKRRRRDRGMDGENRHETLNVWGER